MNLLKKGERELNLKGKITKETGKRNRKKWIKKNRNTTQKKRDGSTQLGRLLRISDYFGMTTKIYCSEYFSKQNIFKNSKHY